MTKNKHIEFFMSMISRVPEGAKITFDGYEEGESWEDDLKNFQGEGDFYTIDLAFKALLTTLLKEKKDLLDKIPHIYIEDAQGKPLLKIHDHFDYIEVDETLRNSDDPIN